TLEDTIEFLSDITGWAKNRTYMPYLILDETIGILSGFLI
ncbi:MAG: hypothetical protein JWR18_2571, partial [Segetibacter sp.]|nr:hypothetical protein [Segetibacter sp.]